MKISIQGQIRLYTSLAILFVTGIIWAVAHYMLPSSSPFQQNVSPLEPYSLKIHGAAAMVFLIVFGALIPVHMRRAWVAKRNLITGIVIVSVCLILIVTGYGLYYWGEPDERINISLIHLGIGIIFPVLLLAHALRGRSITRALKNKDATLDSRPLPDQS